MTLALLFWVNVYMCVCVCVVWCMCWSCFGSITWFIYLDQMCVLCVCVRACVCAHAHTHVCVCVCVAVHGGWWLWVSICLCYFLMGQLPIQINILIDWLITLARQELADDDRTGSLGLVQAVAGWPPASPWWGLRRHQEQHRGTDVEGLLSPLPPAGWQGRSDFLGIFVFDVSSFCVVTCFGGLITNFIHTHTHTHTHTHHHHTHHTQTHTVINTVCMHIPIHAHI